jgi:hypothetical protein
LTEILKLHYPKAPPHQLVAGQEPKNILNLSVRTSFRSLLLGSKRDEAGPQDDL